MVDKTEFGKSTSDTPVSARIRLRLHEAAQKYRANDNIAEFIAPGEIDTTSNTEPSISIPQAEKFIGTEIRSPTEPLASTHSSRHVLRKQAGQLAIRTTTNWIALLTARLPSPYPVDRGVSLPLDLRCLQIN